MNIVEPIRGAKSNLTYPTGKYIESKEGVEEYKKVGLSYPRNAWDNAYREFLKRTPSAEEGNEYAKQNYTRILSIGRIRLQGGKEYLGWNQIEVRFDTLGNAENFSRTNLGVYPKLRFRSVRIEDERGLKRTITQPTGEADTAYSLPFTVDNLDKLHKDCTDNSDFELQPGDPEGLSATRYYVTDLRSHTKISVESYDDLRNGEFEDLYNYGKKITSPKQENEAKKKIEKRKKQLENMKLQKLQLQQG